MVIIGFLLYSGAIYISPHFIIRGIFLWALFVLIIGTLETLMGG
jgi:hypothetical protein